MIDFKIHNAETEINKLGMYFEGLATKLSSFIENDFTLVNQRDFIITLPEFSVKASAIQEIYSEIDRSQNPENSLVSNVDDTKTLPLEEVMSHLSILYSEAVGLSKVFINYRVTDKAEDVVNAIRSVLSEDDILSSAYLSSLVSLKTNDSVISSMLSLLRSMSNDAEKNDTYGVDVSSSVGSSLIATIMSSSIGSIVSAALPVIASAIGGVFGVVGSIIGYAISAVIQLIPNIIRASKGLGPIVKYNSSYNIYASDMPMFLNDHWVPVGANGFTIYLGDTLAPKMLEVPLTWIRSYLLGDNLINVGSIKLKLHIGPKEGSDSYVIYGTPCKENQHNVNWNRPGQSQFQNNLFGADLLQMLFYQRATNKSKHVIIDTTGLDTYLAGMNVDREGGFNNQIGILISNDSSAQVSLYPFDSQYDVSSDFSPYDDDDYSSGSHALISMYSGFAKTMKAINDMYFVLNCTSDKYSGWTWRYDSTAHEFDIVDGPIIGQSTIQPWLMGIQLKLLAGSSPTGTAGLFSNDDLLMPFGSIGNENIFSPKIDSTFTSTENLNNLCTMFSDKSANYENMSVDTHWRLGYASKDYSTGSVNTYYDQAKRIVNIPSNDNLVNMIIFLLYLNYLYAYGDPDMVLSDDEFTYLNTNFDMLPVGLYRGSIGDSFAIQTVSDIERNVRLAGKIIVGGLCIIAAVAAVAKIAINRKLTARRNTLEANKWSLLNQYNEGSIDQDTYTLQMRRSSFKDRIFSMFGGKSAFSSTGLAAASGSVLGSILTSVESITTDDLAKQQTLIEVSNKIN